MDVTDLALTALLALTFSLLSAKILALPTPLTLRAALNALLGLSALLAVNTAGGAAGLSLGFDLISAAVAGILGVPGVGLLFCLKWLFA